MTMCCEDVYNENLKVEEIREVNEKAQQIILDSYFWVVYNEFIS
jgi:hypothetical protein